MVRHLREVVAVCLVVLMLPRMISLAGADMSYVETTVFRDDFESYRAGVFPSSGGWVLKYDGLGYRSQYVTNQTSCSPVKSLQLIGAPMWASAVDRNINRRILADKEAVGFEACVRVDDYGYSPEVGDRTAACICFANRTLEKWGRLYSAIRFLSNGKIYAVTAVTEGFEYLQDYSLRQWYKVRVVVDIAADRFDIWIDGQPRGSFIIRKGHASEIAALNIASGHATSRVYFDDVEVFGRFSGNDTRAGVKSEHVDLEASQHYLRKIGLSQSDVQTDKFPCDIGPTGRPARVTCRDEYPRGDLSCHLIHVTKNDNYWAYTELSPGGTENKRALLVGVRDNV